MTEEIKITEEKKENKKEKKNSKELEKLLEEKATLEETIKSLEEKVKYSQAELINYRKRKDEETENMLKYANKDLIVQLLPIVDNFERAIKLDDDKLDDEEIMIVNRNEIITRIDELNIFSNHSLSQILRAVHN